MGWRGDSKLPLCKTLLITSFLFVISHNINCVNLCVKLWKVLQQSLWISAPGSAGRLSSTSGRHQITVLLVSFNLLILTVSLRREREDFNHEFQRQSPLNLISLAILNNLLSCNWAIGRCFVSVACVTVYCIFAGWHYSKAVLSCVKVIYSRQLQQLCLFLKNLIHSHRIN